MKTKMIVAAAVVAGVLTVVSQATAQDTAMLKSAIDGVSATQFEFYGDEVDGSLALSEVRYVGEANTHDGPLKIFFVRFTGNTVQGQPVAAVRVVYLDGNFHSVFSHSIGCGATDVALKGAKNQILVLGHREYDLTIETWREPIIRQQSFC